MTPAKFIETWQNTTLNEEQGAQLWFDDLCDLIDHLRPVGVLDGQVYSFEHRIETGKADCYYENHFAWEFKTHERQLDEAMRQVLGYSMYLKTPPLLIVSAFSVIRIRTNFPGMASVQHEIRIADLMQPEKLDLIKRVFTNPESFNTGKSRDDVTKETAALFQAISNDMVGAGYSHQDLAQYLNQIIFCLYAEDTGLLPAESFTGLAINQRRNPEMFRRGARNLFAEMNGGGLFGPQTIDHFNGELFASVPDVTLNTAALERLAEAAGKNWSNIEPSIFGTLFERALGLTEERAPLGAHYTGEADIRRVVAPVILDGWEGEWERAKSDADTAKAGGDIAGANVAMLAYRRRIAKVKILDPACGSGNFLYVTLKALLDLERRAMDYQTGAGARPGPPRVSPTQMMGLEVNEYAAQLAKTALWIGYIQWHQANGFEYTNRPILDNIDGIECRDAVLTTGSAAAAKAKWPAADYIIGNPPFLGAKNMLAELGGDYTNRLRQAYGQELDGAVDLCCYWFEQARAQIAAGWTRRAGLLGTQGIRFSSNRRTLERIKETGDIFAAYDDLEWKPGEPDSAAVHVSIVCFDDGSELSKTLNGSPASDIDARLCDAVYLDQAQSLSQNAGICFRGIEKGGPFDLTPQDSATMLADSNPNGQPNSHVVKRYLIGSDLNGRPKERWLVDFGTMPEAEARLYNLPYQHCLNHVKPVRDKNKREHRRKNWWMSNDATPALNSAIAPLTCYVGTSQISKHRFFQFIDAGTTPNNKVTVFAREDNYFLGILESRFHKVWTAAIGTQLREKESGQTYIITDCFEKFPFPTLTPAHRQAVANAAQTLDAQRRNVCQPNGIYRRSMTNLYNENPPWLQSAHADLDQAVADAYGWAADMSDNDILKGLVRLNVSGNAGVP